jgi:hypothetical protein
MPIATLCHPARSGLGGRFARTPSPRRDTLTQ